jgi:hypothetical protein
MTKITGILGAIFGFISLAQIDIISKIILTSVSIISFIILIIINLDKCEEKLRKIFKSKKKIK